MMGIVGRGMKTVGGAGGSVGSGGMGVFVAGTAVGRTDVRVGLTRVDVGASVESPVAVETGRRVRRVAVGRNVEVGLGVPVADGVGVGIVEVMVGISDGVWVGTVEVGKGPSRASEVSARAVLVPGAPNASPPMPGPRKANQSQRIAAMKKASIPALRRLDRLPVKFNS